MSRYQKIGIVTKPHAENLQDVLPDVCSAVESHGCEVFVDRQAAKFLDEKYTPARRKELVEFCDMLIVLGGDGTMLSLAQFQKHIEKPILGINMGSLGFLTEISVDDAIPMIHAALESRLEKSYRMMLMVELVRKGQVEPLHHVLNDVVINKSALARIFEVDVVINNEKITTIRADGIIVSTPTGSTAYNLAANGPIVHPEMGVMLLTPICPHTLTYRPVVLNSTSVLELSMRDSEETYLTLDGQAGFPLEKDDVVRVRKSSRRMTLLSPPKSTFFKVLRNKLKWGNR